MRILWIPHTGWHIPQRAHLFCRALAETYQVHVTDWVADFSSVQDYFSRRYLRNFVYRRYRDAHITVHGIPRFSPALFVPILRRLNTAIFARYVRRIIQRAHIDVVVGTFVVPPPSAPRLVFDLFDDNVAYWRSFGRVTGYAGEIKKVQDAYLQQADAVVAASSVLANQARAEGARGSVHHIPNGVDLRRFEGTNGAGVHATLGVGGRLVGSVGNHDKAVELNKILDAARMLADQDVTFLIAGRGRAVPSAQENARRAGLDNVVFKGYIPLEEAADVISALDVGLCPYEKTPGADASSPMRLLMYTAAGLPTVCTELESVRRLGLPNVVLVADNAAALARGIKQALKLPRARPPQIAKYDLEHVVAQYESVLRGGA